MAFKWSKILKLSITTVAVFSKVTAGFAFSVPVPPAPAPGQKWAVVRDNLNRKPGAGELNPEIADFMSRVQLDSSLERTIRMSYAMATASEIESLDRLWIDTLVARASSKEMEIFLRVRGTIELPRAGESQYYLENWLWLAQSSGDCDNGPGGPQGDNGFGNGDDEAPGGSEPNNNAENANDGEGRESPGNSGSNGNN